MKNTQSKKIHVICREYMYFLSGAKYTYHFRYFLQNTCIYHPLRITLISLCVFHLKKYMEKENIYISSKYMHLAINYNYSQMLNHPHKGSSHNLTGHNYSLVGTW